MTSLVGKRDRALLLFGWASGGRRRSEIVAASFENVRRDGAGFVYELGRSKTNQSGRREPKDFKPIQGAAAEALQAWIEVLFSYRITEGALFRAIRHERILGAAVRLVGARDRAAARKDGGSAAGKTERAFTEVGICHRGGQAGNLARRNDGDDRSSQCADGDGVFSEWRAGLLSSRSLDRHKAVIGPRLLLRW